MEFMFPGMNLFWGPIHNHINLSRQGYIDSESGPKKLNKAQEQPVLLLSIITLEGIGKKMN